ncbi:hypothetical protein ACFV19_14810 [Streptomyces griseoluteus]
MDPELLERITARGAEREQLEERPAKPPAVVQDQRDELAAPNASSNG